MMNTTMTTKDDSKAKARLIASIRRNRSTVHNVSMMEAIDMTSADLHKSVDELTKINNELEAMASKK